MASVARVFAALGDPTRAGIVELLAGGDALRVTEVAEAFASTRQTVTRHLDILCAAGITVSEWRGRERHTRLAQGWSDPVWDWVRHYDRFWDHRLAALKSLVEAESEE